MGLRWVPTWKSLPNQVCDPKTKKRINSCFLSLPYEFAAYLEMADEEISLSGGYSYQLAYPATLFAYDHKSPFHQYSNMVCLIRSPGVLIRALWDRVKPKGYGEGRNPKLAIPNRISGSREGRGKLRLFVIGNYVKQRLLRPLHDWAMDLLRRPTSATTPVVPMTSVTTLSVGDRFHGAMHNGSTGWNSCWSNRTCGQLSMGQKRRTFRDQLETRSQSVGPKHIKIGVVAHRDISIRIENSLDRFIYRFISI